ncbi:MAG: electron transfer flavoprotein subunit beta/FixA family protein [Nitrososphaerota archaeon]|nr:electron transfer flavoprotein subunit beta/FixA family protein [Nitrososphaerota archaeon]
MGRGFRIVVLIKQVPDIEKVKFDFEVGRIDRSSAPAETNPFDLHALEAAVRLKEKFGGLVTAISMGPKQAESSLREALARGADHAILLTDARFAGADTIATSRALAAAIKKLGEFDLILCGEKTVDGDTGQVGPEVAELLNVPHVAYVSEIREVARDKIVVVSDMGDKYLCEVKLPALLTVTRELNAPRLPTLRDVLSARKKRIEIWDADALADYEDPNRFGINGSRTIVVKVVVPGTEKRKGIILRGGDAVEKLFNILEEGGFARP